MSAYLSLKKIEIFARWEYTRQLKGCMLTLKRGSIRSLLILLSSIPIEGSGGVLSHRFQHIPFLRTDDIHIYETRFKYYWIPITRRHQFLLSSVITISSPVAKQTFVVSVLCSLFLNNNVLNCSFYSQHITCTKI